MSCVGHQELLLAVVERVKCRLHGGHGDDLVDAEKLLHFARSSGLGLDEHLGGASSRLRCDILDGDGTVGAQAKQREAVRQIWIAVGDEVARAGLGEPESNIDLLVAERETTTRPNIDDLHAQAELLGDGRSNVDIDARRSDCSNWCRHTVSCSC